MATRTKAVTRTLPAIGLRSAGITMTPKEFDAITRYDERFRYELIRGVLTVTPIAGGGETSPNEILGHLLLTYQEQQSEGKILDDSLPQQYVFLPKSRRLADRLIWTGLGRVPDREKDLPTIFVEFVSRARRDWLRDYVAK